MNDSNALFSRRRLLRGAVQSAALLLLAGCDTLSQTEWMTNLLGRAEQVTQRAQRLISPRRAMAKEYSDADISPIFPANGHRNPATRDYQRWVQHAFATWRLVVGGLVDSPATLSLADLRALPARTQITRHDCVEGWSAIAKWTGTPLAAVLARVHPHPDARYVVFHCADSDEDGVVYYESLDFDDAFHPQTILAYEMNDAPLSIAHGAPLRLRVERQLGYKHAKYITRIELVDSLSGIGGGRGGYWEDQGYEWYAGI